MNLRRNKKGFTLAELLIVVAIIAILIAVLVPTFSASLNKSRHAVDLSNVRSAYSEGVVEYMTEDTLITKTFLEAGIENESTISYTGPVGDSEYGTITVTLATVGDPITGHFKVDPAALDATVKALTNP